MSKNAFITLTFPRGKERKAGETSTDNPRNHRCASSRRITVDHAWRVARENSKEEEKIQIDEARTDHPVANRGNNRCLDFSDRHTRS